MAVFFTGQGDAGISHVGKDKLPKDSPFLDALGDLDETNSFIGLVRSLLENKEIQKKLKNVQESLFVVQANIASLAFSQVKAPPFTQERVQALEKEIEDIAQRVQLEGKFIIAGDTQEGAWFDVARTIVRRAERRVVGLSKEHLVSQDILSFLNRLSSYLYALARLSAHQESIKESNPLY